MESDPRNPYAPPEESSGAAPALPADGSLSLSADGWQIVSSLASWMRIVAVSEWVGAGLFLVVGLAMLAMMSRLSIVGGSRWGAYLFFMIFVAALLFALGGLWLRQAATHFYEGVLGDAERPLAEGFRKLRLYLILYGLYSLLGLGGQIYQLVFHRGG